MSTNIKKDHWPLISEPLARFYAECANDELYGPAFERMVDELCNAFMAINPSMRGDYLREAIGVPIKGDAIKPPRKARDFSLRTKRATANDTPFHSANTLDDWSNPERYLAAMNNPELSDEQRESAKRMYERLTRTA